MRTEDLHRHVCSVTGKGMSEGFLFHDDCYIKDDENALEYAKSSGFKTLQESYDAGYHYWTEWYDFQDLEDEGEAFDDDGNLYFFRKGKWVEDIDLQDYDIVGGDGVEHEIWEHKENKHQIKIPIEIVRNLEDVEFI